MHLEVPMRELRRVIASSGAVVELTQASGERRAVVIKDRQVDAVRGDIIHIDFMGVNLDVAIGAVAHIELVGVDEAPGTKEGGVLSQPAHELNLEALPSDIPDAVRVDVSSMGIGDTLTLADIVPPQGVTFLDDPEIVVATVTAPTKVEAVAAVEEETGVVGQEGAAEAAEGEAETKSSGG